MEQNLNLPDSNLENLDLQRLRHLAEINGISTRFWDWHGNHLTVGALTLLEILEELGLPVNAQSTNQEIEAAILATEERPWRLTLPETTVVRQGRRLEIPVHVPHGAVVQVTYQLEDGGGGKCLQLDRWVPPREIDGQLVGRATFEIPGDLPLGYHTVTAHVESGEDFAATRQTRPLYVVPERIEPEIFATRERFWGVNVQAYSVLSKGSWGLGDALDLVNLTAICAERGADFVLINPVHACEPVPPVQHSPYLPVARNWLNITYIRPEAIDEYEKLGETERAQIANLHAQSNANNSEQQGAAKAFDIPDLLDRDRAWLAKAAALEIVFRVERSLERQEQFRQFCEQGGEGLDLFARWCALVEANRSMDLPPEWSVPDSPAVLHKLDELQSRIDFYKWCQWNAATQFAEVARLARQAGMSIGLMADLAVGTHPGGADVWAGQKVYAQKMSVGAPPDMYSQQGQNWSQPPFNPRALQAEGYRTYIQILRSAFSFAGALRIDHILGLFRLWWIPRGESASQGAYVAFDHEALVGILCLEATRARAIVVGEDLGTVEPWVAGYLAERGILGTSVLWFEQDGAGWPKHPREYRRDVLATVNTHDLPPTLGYVQGVQTQVRERLGLLVDSLEQVQAADRQEQERIQTRLREYGLLSAPAQMDSAGVSADDLRGEVVALHRYLVQAPSRLFALALVDAVGESRPQNVPGTYLEYPNWRIPLADSQGARVWLEDLPHYQSFIELTRIFNQEIHPQPEETQAN